MSKEMTAEEYLNDGLQLRNFFRPNDLLIGKSKAINYGDLRAKEAVREFAEEFRAFMLSQGLIGCADILLAYAKQKGVNL